MSYPIETIRHSMSHILAAAVLTKFADAKISIGPAIDNGFYYDFDLSCNFTPQDLIDLEKNMRGLINKDLIFEQRDLSKIKAKELFKDQSYKLELIENIEDKNVSIYDLKTKTGEIVFTDLCAGPHVDSTKDLQKTGWQLDKIAGAYWKGNEKNKMLQRIYGLAFISKQELHEYLANREEAEKRDHRKIGKELELFIISDLVGAGLPIWLPKGAQLRDNLQQFLRNHQIKNGYLPVISPHIAKEELFKKSGHIPYYMESMFNPIQVDNEKYYLRPVNCPMHIQVYKNKIQSYRDLPVRLAEFGTVYRYEKSGELSGLTRVRMITQDDAHIFCRHDQVQSEFKDVLNLILKIFKLLNFKEYRARIGIRSADKKDKYLGDDEIWTKAEKDIINAVRAVDLKYSIEEGDAAIYGPKLDFIVKDVMDREWQLGTVQLDYNLPERFDISYIDEDGQPQRPVMIHRAPFGSLERFIGILIEHFAGAFPIWLAPLQVIVLPISEKHVDYAKDVFKTLEEQKITVEIDERNESLGKKIREAEMKKIPYIVIVGDKEIESQKIAIRKYSEGDKGQIDKTEFIKKIQEEINISF